MNASEQHDARPTLELEGDATTDGPLTLIGWAVFLAVVAIWPVAVFAVWALLLRATT